MHLTEECTLTNLPETFDFNEEFIEMKQCILEKIVSRVMTLQA